jgi:hypothetical protein
VTQYRQSPTFADLRRWITHDGKRGCPVINLMAEIDGIMTGVQQQIGAWRLDPPQRARR